MLGTTTNAILFALATHQIFKRYETYSLIIHAALLVVPPAILAAQEVASADPSVSIFSTLRVLASLSATYYLSLGTSIVVYRLSPFHPLTSYPGPFVARTSKFWMACIAVSGKQHEYLRSLHKRYGDVVRIGPNELSIANASTVPGILGSSGLRKGPQLFGRLLSADSYMMVVQQDTEYHLQRRRPWTRGLSVTAVKEYEERIGSRAKLLVARMGEQQGSVDLDKWIKYFAYDFMSDMAFGGGSELLRGKDKDEFWMVLDGSLPIATFFQHVPWLGAHVGRIPAAGAQAAEAVAYCADLTQKRIARGAEKKDLFYYLNHEDMPEKGPPPLQHLVDDGMLAMVAGSDTVASALTSVFSCLMAHPDVYERLQVEIDKHYPAGEDVADTRRYPDMKYLTAVINETMRLFPPVPGCTQRQEPHDSPGSTFGSTFIPPGTNITVHAYTMHRDPRYFSPSPEGFWPERWLIAAGDAEAVAGFVHDEMAFVPFSSGPMNCAGKGLAMQEMRVVVCAVLQRVRVHPAEAWTMEAYAREYRDYFVTTRGSVPVVLEVR